MNKKVLTIALILLASVGYAATYTLTANYSLYKITPGDKNWATEMNNNFDLIDGQMKTNADAISAKTECSTASCDLHEDTTLNTQNICLEDGTNCPAAGSEADPVVGAVTGIVKADGAGNISAAVAGTDYQAALTNPLVQADVDDTPVNGVTTAPVSSNWAYDHVAAADPHTGYMLESNIGTGANNYLKLGASPGTPDGSKYLRDDMTWQTVSGGSGAPTDAEYLVSTANGTLSAEKVVSANGLALVQAVDYAAMKTLLDTDDIQTLTGIAAGTANLGTFTGSTITDNQTIKAALQLLETAVETKAPSTAPTFATSITGSYLTASEMLITDGSKKIVSAPVATYPSLTELSYVKGLSSAVQTQITAKGAHAGQVWTGVHDFGGATSFEVPNGTSPTVDAAGEIAVDTTTDQLVFYGGAKRVVTYIKSPCAVVPDLAAADDNFPLGSTTYARTITKIGCRCNGTCTTGATITLEDTGGNAMTITDTNPTCATSGDIVFKAVTAGNTLGVGEGLRMDVTNAVSPETDDYEICWEEVVTAD